MKKAYLLFISVTLLVPNLCGGTNDCRSLFSKIDDSSLSKTKEIEPGSYYVFLDFSKNRTRVYEFLVEFLAATGRGPMTRSSMDEGEALVLDSSGSLVKVPEIVDYREEQDVSAGLIPRAAILNGQAVLRFDNLQTIEIPASVDLAQVIPVAKVPASKRSKALGAIQKNILQEQAGMDNDPMLAFLAEIESLNHVSFRKGKTLWLRIPNLKEELKSRGDALIQALWVGHVAFAAVERIPSIDDPIEISKLEEPNLRQEDLLSFQISRSNKIIARAYFDLENNEVLIAAQH